jgi:hypothetical protein
MVTHSDIPRWRVGRSVGRTVYRMVGDDPSKDDELIGVMDTRALAETVVTLHNAAAAVADVVVAPPPVQF